MNFALLDLPIGTCSLVWSARTLLGVGLPEATPERLLARLRRRWPSATEAAPPEAGELIAAHLRGDRVDLAAIEVDLSGVPQLSRRIYEFIRGIPPGETMTYGQIAAALGEPGAARAIGRAMGGNPVPIVVPCHRVVGANGTLGGFTAHDGRATKLRLLEIERAAWPRPEATLF